MAANAHTSRHPEQAAGPTIMVVANDLKLLKLLDMALKLELSCDVLPFASGKSAQESAKHIRPDLEILDDQLLDLKAHDLADQLHHIPGLEHIPTLIINTATASLSESQDYPIIMLRMRWKLEEMYSAVYQLLGRSS